MRAIVRAVNVPARKFCVECNDGTWAAFRVVRGGFPYGGEFVKWSDVTPVAMVMGESSGSIIVGEFAMNTTRDEAYRFIAG